MIDNKKTVLTVGAYSIVRIQSYGFRCNTLSSEWEVMQNGECIGHYIRLKDAKKYIQSLTA
tara:strand:- start:630 stop:812 length:183 start_codon:yes stop_codon:yes gene_type:complete